MGVSKVIYGDNTLVDLTGDTVAAEKMLSGTTAHDKAGNAITGTIATKTASNMTASGATVTAPAGYYASAAKKSVATATQATPTISVDSAGKITASATQTAGYVSAGTKSATKQLTVQAAQTITPGTADQTIASGVYLTGNQTIKGDANLVPENIASGVSIFGVEGTMEAGGGGDIPTISITNGFEAPIGVCGAEIYPGETAEVPWLCDGAFMIGIVFPYTALVDDFLNREIIMEIRDYNPEMGEWYEATESTFGTENGDREQMFSYRNIDGIYAGASYSFSFA